MLINAFYLYQNLSVYIINLILVPVSNLNYFAQNCLRRCSICCKVITVPTVPTVPNKYFLIEVKRLCICVVQDNIRIGISKYLIQFLILFDYRYKVLLVL